MPAQDAAARAEYLRSSSRQKFEQWFKDRHWRVCTEMTGNRVKDGYIVIYYKGFFQVTPPGTFQTPLGHRGRSGYLIQETDAGGTDLPGTEPVPFGRAALLHAIEEFGLVKDLPKRDPRRRAGTWAD